MKNKYWKKINYIYKPLIIIKLAKKEKINIT